VWRAWAAILFISNGHGRTRANLVGDAERKINLPHDSSTLVTRQPKTRHGIRTTASVDAQNLFPAPDLTLIRPTS